MAMFNLLLGEAPPCDRMTCGKARDAAEASDVVRRNERRDTVEEDMT
jgi:hypothetical protein